MQNDLIKARTQKTDWKRRYQALQGRFKKTKKENSNFRRAQKVLLKENKTLKITVKKQKSEITKTHTERMKLNAKIREASGAVSKTAREQLIRSALKGILSKAQIDRILYSKQSHWSADDIMASTILLSHSSRAYRFLREEMHLPLPAVSTLKLHVSKLPVEAGILKAALLLMASRAKCMPELHRVTCLSFDEVHVCSDFVYDPKEDIVLGGNSKTQVAMAHGLFSPWKGPVFYQHDQPMTEELLDMVITELHEAGFQVVSVVSDMGPENIGLYREMGVNDERPYFLHPVTGRKIVCFHDPPHLLKLARNHMIDQGFILNPSSPKKEQEIVSSKPLEQLIRLAPGRDVPLHHVTKRHLACAGCDRQIVKLASQVLSQKSAVALEEAGRTKLIKSDDYLVIIYILDT